MAFLRILLLLLALTAATVRAEWQLFQLEGRDYVSLNNVAEFYGLNSDFVLANNKLSLKSDRKQFEVTLNSREVFINGVKHWLAFPVHMQEGKLLVSRLDLAKTIEPMMRPELIAGLQPVETVVLDPGHGGHDKGAHSKFGYEKDFALDVALRTKKLLEAKGYKVVMTRSTDVFIPLHERPAVANKIRNSIFVSIHFNSSLINPLARGIEVFSVTPRGAPSTADQALSTRDLRNEPNNEFDLPSAALAASIHHSMLGTIPDTDRGLKRARFAVVRLARVPAVLVEGAFLSNAEESRRVATTNWRNKFAESIFEGIEDYKRLAEKKEPLKLVADYNPSDSGAGGGADVVAPAPTGQATPTPTPAPEATPAPSPTPAPTAQPTPSPTPVQHTTVPSRLIKAPSTKAPPKPTPAPSPTPAPTPTPEATPTPAASPATT